MTSSHVQTKQNKYFLTVWLHNITITTTFRTKKFLIRFTIFVCCAILFFTLLHSHNARSVSLTFISENNENATVARDQDNTIIDTDAHLPVINSIGNFFASNVENNNGAPVSSHERKSKSSVGIISAEGQQLGKILDEKLKAFSGNCLQSFKPTCNTKAKRKNSCNNNRCLQTELPSNVIQRVKQLTEPSQLQLLPDKHRILREMAGNISDSYDIILLTAASSNHFLESQALLKNLHEIVFPLLKNFTLILYNIGLTEHERNLFIKYCKCHVLDFPFDKFPSFMKKLQCYSWKPVVIKAHLQQANVILWMDASIRFHNTPNVIHALINNTRERGVQISGVDGISNFRTFQSMYHFFGDEPCAYETLGQAQATFGAYHREYFVDRVILEPWVACAVQEKCMCPDPRVPLSCSHSIRMALEYDKGRVPIPYGLCHRYDQSAISIILHKLYQEHYLWVMVNVSSVVVPRRQHRAHYFPEI